MLAPSLMELQLDADEAHVYTRKVCIAALQSSTHTAELPATSINRGKFNNHAILNWLLHNSRVKTSLEDLP